MNIVIKPLTPDLTSYYLDFFDNRAFSDGNPCGPCYCNAPIMDTLSIRQMESEFGDDAKGVLRRYAVKQLTEEKIHGYLAFDADIPVGWCNAGNIDTYMINSFDFIPDNARQNARGKTMSVVCFAIAPGYRGKGIATALLERVVTDARAEGYAAVEGYAEILKEPVYYDFHGPVRLYENAGFRIVARADNRVIFRKVL